MKTRAPEPKVPHQLRKFIKSLRPMSARFTHALTKEAARKQVEASRAEKMRRASERLVRQLQETSPPLEG